MIIRKATIKDLPFIAEIYNRHILQTTASFRDTQVSLKEREKWLAEKEQAGLPVLIAQKQGQNCGFSSLAPFRIGEGYKHTVEHSIYIDDKYQKQGVAKALMRALIVIAKKDGLHAIIAGIDNSNLASHALHRSLGFQHCGTLPQVGQKFGKWLNLTFYCLILN